MAKQDCVTTELAGMLPLDSVTQITCKANNFGTRAGYKWCDRERDNPHKYLAPVQTDNQPAVHCSLLVLASKELARTAGVMLLYLSADGCLGNVKHSDDSKIYWLTTFLIVLSSWTHNTLRNFLWEIHCKGSIIARKK